MARVWNQNANILTGILYKSAWGPLIVFLYKRYTYKYTYAFLVPSLIPPHHRSRTKNNNKKKGVFSLQWGGSRFKRPSTERWCTPQYLYVYNIMLGVPRKGFRLGNRQNKNSTWCKNNMLAYFAYRNTMNNDVGTTRNSV